MKHTKDTLNNKTYDELVELVLYYQEKLKENSITYGGKLPIGLERD